jgi:hypothetical protein
MKDYPKIMTRSGEEISVGGAADEAVKRGEGWSSPLDGPQADDIASELGPGTDPSEEAALAVGNEPDEPEGPTFGPPHDQTHAKRGGKKR